MFKRRKMGRKFSKRVFRHHAGSHRKNNRARVMRGGFRI